MTSDIAGHTFRDDAFGRRVCINCSKPWLLVAHATEADIDKFGFAHIGALTRREYDEICAERDRIWEHVVGVASPQ